MSFFVLVRTATFVVFSLIALALPGKAIGGEKLIDGVPLPGNAVAVAPSDVPEQYSQFAGAWAGRWGDMISHILVVESISADGSAHVIYANGNQPEWNIKRGWHRQTATIRDGHMQIEGIPASYDAMPDHRLSARYHSAAVGQLDWASNVTAMNAIDLTKALRRGKIDDLTPHLSGAPAKATGSLDLSDAACDMPMAFGSAEPESESVNPAPLLALTRWIGGSRLPIFSVLVSRHGKIVYELYTSRIDRESAHYLMSVTKSFTSALAGAAFGRRLLKGPDETIAEAIPRKVFPDKASYKRFAGITIREAMAMSALDAQVWPHLKTSASRRLGDAFYDGPDRLGLALDQSLLSHPGHDFQYTDVTPQLTAGAVQFASHATLLDFAKTSLFDDMEFRNEEWMHEDAAANDNASYGLRLRPVDMQKFGILYLNQGCWQGKQLLSPTWVKTSFAPWIKSDAGLGKPNYGWYWWRQLFADGWAGHVADGWKGQRIAVFPDKDVVVTMTGAIEEADGNEENIFAAVMNDYVIPAVDGPAADSSDFPRLKSDLAAELEKVHNSEPRFAGITEPRMLPSIKAKERHRPFSR